MVMFVPPALCDGALGVSPTTGLVARRWPGEPISPMSQAYTLTNTGSADINWSASEISDWVSISPAAGSLQPGKIVTVTVSIPSVANGFFGGVYTDAVTFTNLTNGSGNTTRGVTLIVSDGCLEVRPSTAFASVGEPGGPFDPSSATYALQNTGYSSIAWTASKTQNWITLSQDSGTLAPGETVAVAALINSNASSLECGGYIDTVTFANLANGYGNTTRNISLGVGKVMYVDKDSPGSPHDGRSWATAYSTISAAMNAAVSGQEVCVAGGDYGESVTLKGGVALRGGYAASGSLRDINACPTTIATATVADSSTLDGFTIAGTAVYGVYCNNTSPTIVNNTILNLSPSGSSYGVYYTGAASAPVINANRFAKTEWAIFCKEAGAATITNNIMNGNYFGIKLEHAAATSKVINNLVNGSSCGMYFLYSGAAVSNNIVCNCTTGIGASGSGTPLTLSHNDFFNNSVDGSGYTPHPTDIDADPLFANPGAGDFHMPFDSPCVDSGDPANAPEADVDGNARPADGNGDGSSVVDIGPYEAQWTIQSLVVSPSTGLLSMGQTGGPFSPPAIAYTVKNISTSSIQWSVSNTQGWLSLSAPGGILTPGQTAVLTASINSAAASLPDGRYTDTLAFTDLTTGLGNTTRPVTLVVGAVHVNCAASSGVHDGTTWDTAFLTIQEGVDAAVAGQEVWVAQGTYPEGQIDINKNTVLKGGFAGVGTTRNIDTYRTTVQALTTSSRVFWVRGRCTINGFTISGGNVGIQLSYSPASIANNTFVGNQVNGVYCGLSSGATISSNEFIGGSNGVTSYQSSLTVTDNVFSNCGRAMGFSNKDSLVVQRNAIAGGYGGIYCDSSVSVAISNNLIVGCSSRGIYAYGCGGSILNNTIVGCGCGLYCWASPRISNNVIANCTTGIFASTYASVVLSCNDLYGNTEPYTPATIPHASDISVDPLFFNRVAGDYHLLPGSGCIDRGDPAGAPTSDLDGNVRPRDGDGNGVSKVDIGCYECPDHYIALAAAKARPDGAKVGIACAISTAVFGDRFYVEKTDRTCGIGVLGSASAAGKMIQVEGAMSTLSGERMIVGSMVNEGAAAPVPLPFYLNANALGGGQLGRQSAVQDFRFVEHFDTEGNPYWLRELYSYGGANNIGLLVKAVGKVSAIGNGVFYLDGTTSFDDGDEDVKGIAVVWPFGNVTMPPNGATVSIVAISSCQIKGGIVVRMLRPVSSDAVMILKPPDIGPGL